MKSFLLFCAIILSSAVMSQSNLGGISQPKGSGDGLNPGTQKNQKVNTQTNTTGTAARKCCAKIYVSTPAAKKGGKTTNRLLSGNPFKGKERGIDLSFDFLDPNGTAVDGLDHAITTDGSGNVYVDAAKLPAGKKIRLRAKAGKSSETYALN
ncbi:MAG: hypothetical protein IPM92_10480 [Saprospiraceae bacterium]|nr:hypothetical protein [Saprospiraceae bacterium]